jgi:hypothetical protein
MEQVQVKELSPKFISDLIDKIIVTQQFYIFPGSFCTVCCLTLINDEVVIGSNACVTPGNFCPSNMVADHTEYAKKLAYADARREAWKLLGSLTAYELSGQSINPVNKEFA